MRANKITTMSTSSKILPFLIWSIAGLFVLFQFLLQTSSSVMIHDLEKAFNIDVVGVSLLSSSFFYTYLLLQIPAGMAVEYFGARLTLTVCFFGAGVSSLVFANTHLLAVAEISRIFLGLFSAPAVVSALYLAAKWFPGRYFALLAGLTETLGMLGGAAGQALLAYCVQKWGWRETLIICSLTGCFIGCCAWIIVKDKPSHSPSSKTQTKHLMLKNIWHIISFSEAWLNGIFTGLLFAVIAAFAGFWSIPFLMRLYNLSVSSASHASSMMFIGAALGAPILGWLSDQVSQRRLLMGIVTLLSSLMLFMIIYVSIPLALMYGLLFILGFFAGIYVLPFAIMRDVMPSESHSAAMGFTNMMCILLGAPVLQPLIGWILEHHSSSKIYTLADYQFALTVLPLSLIFAWVITFLLKDS